MRHILAALFLILACASSSVFAADYYFKVRGGEPYGLTNSYPSATAACSAWQSAMQNVWGSDWTVETKTEATSTEGSYSCTTTRTRGADVYNNNGTADRYGDSCPANTQYNAQTGTCDSVNQCTDKKGKSFGWGYKTAVGYVTNGGKHGIHEYLNYEGCEATAGDFNCSAANDGSDYGYCKGIGTWTGEVGKTDDTSVGTVASATDPTKATDTTCGTGYTWSGSTCVKNPEKEPDTGTGDGTGTGDTGTGSGDTGSGGSSGGGSSSGGDTGTGSGSGDGTGTGTGTGSGTGTDTDDKDDDDKDGADRKVSGTDCAASMACSGDAIDCAIAQQQKKTYCDFKDNMDLSKGKSSIESDIKADKYQLDETTVDVSSGYFTEGTRWLPTTCPADQYVSLSHLAVRFDMRIPCEAAGMLGHLLVAIAAIFFAVYVGRAFGGE